MDQVFEFFDHIEEGNGIEILFNYPKQPNGSNNSLTAYGIVVSAAIHLKNVGKSISCDLRVRLGTTEYPSNSLIDEEKNCHLLLGTRVWIFFIPFHRLSRVWDPNSCGIKVLITSNSPTVVVEKCGASVLSQQAVPEFLGKIYNKFCASKLWSFHKKTKDPETCVDVEDSFEDRCSDGSISSTENETFKNDSMAASLKMNLKLLLRRVFEVRILSFYSSLRYVLMR